MFCLVAMASIVRNYMVLSYSSCVCTYSPNSTMQLALKFNLQLGVISDELCVLDTQPLRVNMVRQNTAVYDISMSTKEGRQLNEIML